MVIIAQSHPAVKYAMVALDRPWSECQDYSIKLPYPFAPEVCWRRSAEIGSKIMFALEKLSL
jgi:hypothetical protein